MSLFKINHIQLVLFYILLINQQLSIVDSKQVRKTHTPLSSKLRSEEYKKLAKYCYIEDYSAWLHRQQEFFMWFDLAKILRLPVHEDKDFKKELEQYRLQYQCLRFVERLPLGIGPG